MQQADTCWVDGALGLEMLEPGDDSADELMPDVLRRMSAVPRWARIASAAPVVVPTEGEGKSMDFEGNGTMDTAMDESVKEVFGTDEHNAVAKECDLTDDENRGSEDKDESVLPKIDATCTAQHHHSLSCQQSSNLPGQQPFNFGEAPCSANGSEAGCGLETNRTSIMAQPSPADRLAEGDSNNVTEANVTVSGDIMMTAVTEHGRKAGEQHAESKDERLCNADDKHSAETTPVCDGSEVAIEVHDEASDGSEVADDDGELGMSLAWMDETVQHIERCVPMADVTSDTEDAAGRCAEMKGLHGVEIGDSVINHKCMSESKSMESDGNEDSGGLTGQHDNKQLKPAAAAIPKLELSCKDFDDHADTIEVQPCALLCPWNDMLELLCECAAAECMELGGRSSSRCSHATRRRHRAG